ncbi:MAG: bacillithiol biosynthesis deacetylase BshB1 [Catalinimonas sp.]
MKLDILVIAAHPDDAELCCGGTLLVHAQRGLRTGIVDLTRGELGTRGTPDLREKEAADAARILGLRMRENLGLADGFFRNDEVTQKAVIQAVRRYQPDVVLTNATDDRHPDHGRAALLVREACFLSGLAKIETDDEGRAQDAWRPGAVYHFVQDRHLKPDFVIDISEVWEEKLSSILAYRSQFYNPDSAEAETHISSSDFLPFIESRAREMGHGIGVRYGEGFTVDRLLGVRDLRDVFVL